MGRRPIGDKAMTSSERQRRMRQKYRSENQALRDALSPASKRRTKVEMPPGEAADLTNELMEQVRKFFDEFRNVFEPKYRAWRSLKPPPPKRVRTDIEMYLGVVGTGFLKYSPRVQDRLAPKDAVIADLVAERDARIAELKSGEADDENLEWFADRIKSWSPEQRRDAAKRLMKGLDPSSINKSGTQLWLIANMVDDYEQGIALLAGLIRIWFPTLGKKALALGDFVWALESADRKLLAGALATRRRARAHDTHTSLVGAVPRSEASCSLYPDANSLIGRPLVRYFEVAATLGTPFARPMAGIFHR
jgi:hypothetical protein